MNITKKKLQDLILDWRFGHAFDLSLLLAFVLYMQKEDAPKWAIALAFYIGTRPSRVAQAADSRAIKSTITFHYKRKDDEDDD